MFADYAARPARRFKPSPLIGSLAIHVVFLAAIYEVRNVVLHPPDYSAVQLYMPAVQPAPVVLRRPVKPPTPPLLAPHPSTLLAKLPAPVGDLPSPPELSVTRATPPPARQPVFPVPAPVAPAPPAPVFASALPAAAPIAHAPAPRTGSFGSVPTATATAPAKAKLQVAGDTFSTIPAGTLRKESPPGAIVPTGFGSAAVTPSTPHRGPAVAAANNFGGVAIASPANVPPPQAKPLTQPASPAFGAAVAAAATKYAAPPPKAASQALEILFKPRPDYTEEARQARLEGDVVLEVLFNSSGSLRVLRVVRGLGHGLDQNAIDAAGKIRFRPATEDGRAVDTVATVRISFQMAY